MYKSSNPVFNRFPEGQVLDSAPMTVAGTINKAFILFAILAIAAGAVVYQAYMGFADKMIITMYAGLIIGFILALIISFKPKTAPYLSPVYAFAQGAFLGGITLMFETQFQGIALQAIGTTLAAMFVMLFLFKTKLIQATQKFRSVMMTAMLTILGVYLINLLAGWLFKNPLSFIVSSSPISIGISCVIAIIAALMLILDFDFIEYGAKNLLPKYFEWYGAFGLMVTLVWLYLEVLRLFAKLKNR